MVEKVLRLFITALVMVILSSTLVYAAPATKAVDDDRIHAERISEENHELVQVSKQINAEHKADRHKAIMGVGAAALAVGAVYVGGHNWGDLQNKVGVDRVAHFGVSYIICDQLQAAGMNKFWATTTTIAIGAAKEKWVDNKWDKGDFAADCAGALMANIKF